MVWYYLHGFNADNGSTRHLFLRNITKQFLIMKNTARTQALKDIAEAMPRHIDHVWNEAWNVLPMHIIQRNKFFTNTDNFRTR